MNERSLIAAIALTVLTSLPAHARNASENSAHASDRMSTGSALLLTGTLSTAAGSGQLVVAGVQAAGESTIVILKGASDATEVSVKVASGALKELGVAVGASIRVVGDATGHALIASGKMLAYLPNEVGSSLIHQTKLSETKQGRQ